MSLQGTVVPKSIVNRQLQRTNMLVNSRPRTQHVRRQKHTKGVVNKLEKETQSISLHINSIFRDDYYNESPTDYNYTLPINIDLRISADAGKPLVEDNPDHKISKIFKEIANKIKGSFL